MTQHSRTAWQNTLHSIAVASLAVCISAPIHAQTQSGQANATPSLRPGEPVTLNFTNADIEAVSRAMAAITNRNVVVDPRVKGQITLLTDKAVSPATAYQQYLAALRMQGFTVTESMPSCSPARSPSARADAAVRLAADRSSRRSSSSTTRTPTIWCPCCGR